MSRSSKLDIIGHFSMALKVIGYYLGIKISSINAFEMMMDMILSCTLHKKTHHEHVTKP